MTVLPEIPNAWVYLWFSEYYVIKPLFHWYRKQYPHCSVWLGGLMQAAAVKFLS